MADNVEITAGSGTTVATDDAGSKHYQVIKMADGTADSETRIAAGGGVEANALRVTIASDSTGVVSVDDGGGTLTVDGTVTANLDATNTSNIGSIKTAVETLDNAISGSEMQVDVVGSLPAGTALIGKVGIDQVTANANEVVVKSGTVTAVTDITNAVKVTDNDSTLSVDDGGGALTVDGTVAATQSGTWNVGTVTAVTGITNAVAVTDNSSTLSVDDGGGALTVDGTVTANLGATDTGNLAAVKTAVEIIDNAIAGSEMQVDIVSGTVTAVTSITNAVKVTDNDGSLTVDGTVTANLGATDNAVLDDIAAKLATIDADTSTLAAAVSTEVQVDVVGALPAGTNAIGKLAANSGVDIGDVDILSIAAGTNNIGSFIPYAQPASFVSGATANITDTTQTSVIAAQGAGVVIYMTSLQVMNADSETATWVKITDGAGGTTKWVGYADYAGGGFAKVFPTPIAFTANTAVVAECETTGATVRVCVGGYKV